MAKEIALKLKITSQGEEKVISNLNELETELKILQGTLKTLDFGSAAFKEATKNIATLRTKIDEIDKASEGIGAEKKFRAIGDSINILTGSFQVLSGAIGLFVSDEKSLEEVQKAEKAALDVLNVALGINAVNTALVESATLRKTIAEKASALATRAAAVAQAAYNAVLNANPIILFTTAIAALTGAIYLLITATDEETDAQGQSNLQKKAALELDIELAEVQKKTATELKAQTTILTDNVATRNLELQTLEDLKKTYPGFNAFIDKNNQLTKEGINFLRIQIALQEKQATLQSLRTKKADLEIKAVQDVSEAIESQNTIIGRTTNQITQFFKGNIGDAAVFGGIIKDAAKDEEAALSAVNSKINEQTKEVDNLIGQLNPLNKKLNQTATAEANAAKGTKTATTEINQRTLALIGLNRELDNQLAILQDLQKERLAYTSKIIETEDDIINRQKDLLNNQTSLLETEAVKLRKSLDKLLRETIPNDEEAALIQDGYIRLFNTISDLYETGAIDLQASLGFDDFVNEAEKVIPGIGKQLSLVGEEGKQSFVDFYNEVGDRVKAIQVIQKDLGIQVLGDLDATQKLSTIEDKIYKLRKDRVKIGLSENDLNRIALEEVNVAFGLGQKQLELEKQIETTRKKTTSRNEKTKKNAEDQLALLEEQLKKQRAISQELVNQVNRSGDFFAVADKINEEAEKRAQIIRDNLAKRREDLTREELDGLKEYFKANASQFSVLFSDILSNFQEYTDRIGTEGIKELIGSVEEGLMDIDSLTRQQLTKLQSFLKIASAELGDSLGGDAEVLNKILAKIEARLKKLPTDAQESFTKTIDSIKKVSDIVLQSFQQISSQLSNIIQSQNSLLLEQLDYQQAQALKAVDEAADDSVEGQKQRDAERLKIEKEYQKKKFDIEKKARIQELQFQLANALAASAQAIIGALATPPLGVGIALAGVLAGLTAYQVGVINDQVQFVQNKQYLGRTGGLVEGSSHDTYGGGVPTMLEGGEFILNKEAVRAYGDQISSINTATGGKPMSIDDSRIVQAIAKQNLSTKTPLKAYVLYNDIQDTTKLNNKITQLARL